MSKRCQLSFDATFELHVLGPKQIESSETFVVRCAWLKKYFPSRIRKQAVSGPEVAESHPVTQKLQKRKNLAYQKLRKVYALDTKVSEPCRKAQEEVEAMTFEGDEPTTPVNSKYSIDQQSRMDPFGPLQT